MTKKRQDKAEKQTISVIEAGKALGLGKNASYEAVHRGELPVLKIGGRFLIPKAAFERFLADVKPTPRKAG